MKDNQCATFNANLTKQNDTTITYRNLSSGDTLKNIPIGLYNAHFYSCDSSFTYSQNIEIVDSQTRTFNFRNAANIQNKYYPPDNYTDEYYDEYYDSLFPPTFFGLHLQFTRGLNSQDESPNLLNNFAFDYIFGHDVLLTKPIALGYEIGFGFTQANYVSEDLTDPTIKYEKQRFTTFDISFAGMTSIYVKDNRLLTLGARYRLPYFARYARINGNEKLSTRGLHKYNDFSVFAMLGYDWGFVFAEYKFDQFLKDPVGELPSLSIGIRFGFMEEW